MKVKSMKKFLAVMALSSLVATVTSMVGCAAVKTANTAAQAATPDLATALASLGQYLLHFLDALVSGAFSIYLLPLLGL